MEKDGGACQPVTPAVLLFGRGVCLSGAASRLFLKETVVWLACPASCFLSPATAMNGGPDNNGSPLTLNNIVDNFFLWREEQKAILVLHELDPPCRLAIGLRPQPRAALRALRPAAARQAQGIVPVPEQRLNHAGLPAGRSIWHGIWKLGGPTTWQRLAERRRADVAGLEQAEDVQANETAIRRRHFALMFHLIGRDIRQRYHMLFAHVRNDDPVELIVVLRYIWMHE